MTSRFFVDTIFLLGLGAYVSDPVKQPWALGCCCSDRLPVSEPTCERPRP